MAVTGDISTALYHILAVLQISVFWLAGSYKAKAKAYLGFWQSCAGESCPPPLPPKKSFFILYIVITWLKQYKKNFHEQQSNLIFVVKP